MSAFFHVFKSKKPVAGKISYILKPGKAACYTVMNLIEDENYAAQFRDTMDIFGRGKEDGEIKYLHVVISGFARDNPSPEKVLDCAACIMRAIMPNYEIVIAVHTDIDSIHAHAIVNAIDPVVGHKPNFSLVDLVAMRKEAEKIAVSFGFHPYGYFPDIAVRRLPAEIDMISRGKACWKEDIREVVREAKRTSHSEEEFAGHLKEYGVKIVKSDTDYLYLHPETKKTVWGKTLGNDFTKQEVIKYVTYIKQDRNATGSDSERVSVVQRDDGENIVGGRCEATGIDRGNAGVGSGVDRDSGNFAAEGSGIAVEGRIGTEDIAPEYPEDEEESADSVCGSTPGVGDGTRNEVLGNGAGMENVGKGGKSADGNSRKGWDAFGGKPGEGDLGPTEDVEYGNFAESGESGDDGYEPGEYGDEEYEDDEYGDFDDDGDEYDPARAREETLAALKRLRELSENVGIERPGHIFSDEYLCGMRAQDGVGTAQMGEGEGAGVGELPSEGLAGLPEGGMQRAREGADGEGGDASRGDLGMHGEAGRRDEGASAGSRGDDAGIQRMSLPEDERD
ncbi:MAG: relaxase/mobilization nuclease domain-containing protein, partial [Clostridia bacterium]|nr:relaxase/mobilization nuclease domain-containing protein [Clostridia bacterium]